MELTLAKNRQTNNLASFSRVLACTAFAVLSTAWAAGGAEPPAADGTTPPTQSTQSTELQQLKAQIDQQKKQIEELRVTLEAQQKLLEKAENTLEKAESVQQAENAAPAEPAHKAPNLGDVASTTPIIPRGVAPVPVTALPSPAAAQQSAAATPPTSPLQIHIGDATITPVGFMDLTNTWRSTNNGSGFATNFGSIPYNNTVGGRLTQNQLSAGNSRIGFRVDALFKDIHVLGYYEGDFVGTPAAFNTQVTSNSLLYRIRLYWVDLRKGKYELLAGQSWSMLTPNRNGLSALPGDLFYGQQFDVNYLNGLTWGRIPGIRFLYHPNNVVTWGISAENATQYFGGSGGAGTPTLPAALTSLTSNQLDANVVNGQGLPTVMPDIISKLVIQPSSRVHVEFAGVLDHARVFNPNNPPALGAQQHFSTTGAGGSVNGNFEVVKNFRLITNNFWSDGAGRYLFGQAPNFIVRSNGSLSNIHAGSTLNGFEARIKNTQLYGYYGLIYIQKNVALDANGTSFIGWGYPGSSNAQNKTTQEGTIGITQTFFNDPKYGAVSMYLDYAYFFRNPWFVAPGTPRNAHQSAVWFDLRYTLPGSAPTIRY